MQPVPVPRADPVGGPQRCDPVEEGGATAKAHSVGIATTTTTVNTTLQRYKSASEYRVYSQLTSSPGFLFIYFFFLCTAFNMKILYVSYYITWSRYSGGDDGGGPLLLFHNWTPWFVNPRFSAGETHGKGPPPNDDDGKFYTTACSRPTIRILTSSPHNISYLCGRQVVAWWYNTRPWRNC